MITDFQGVIHLDSEVQDPRCNNSASKFTNFMHCPFVYTSDDFEVGLHEIQLPYTWINLHSNQAAVIMDNDTCLSGLRVIHAGCYHSFSELILLVNSLFASKDESRPQLVLEESGKIKAERGLYRGREGRIWLTKELAAMLGFSNRFFVIGPAPVISGLGAQLVERFLVDRFHPTMHAVSDRSDTACHSPSVHMNLPRLLVCSSLVKHVTHSKGQLLRAVPAEALYHYGQIVVKTFDRPIFVPLTHGSFDRIDIRITDSDDREIDFLTGNVIVALEFRKRKNAER